TGIMASRLAYGMARDGLLPGALARVLPGRRTPWVAIAVTTACSTALALTGEIAVLAGTLVLLLLVVFAAVNAAVLILRREPAESDHFRVPTVLPWLGLASCALLATRVEGEMWVRGLLLLGLGLLLAVVNGRRARRGRGRGARPAPGRRPPGRTPAGG